MSENLLNTVLVNQLIIMHVLSALIEPHCKGSAMDKHGETRRNVALIERIHATEDALGFSRGQIFE